MSRNGGFLGFLDKSDKLGEKGVLTLGQRCGGDGEFILKAAGQTLGVAALQCVCLILGELSLTAVADVRVFPIPIGVWQAVVPIP